MTTKAAIVLAVVLAVSVVGGLALHAYIANRVDVAKYDQLHQDVQAASKKAEAIGVAAEQDRKDAEKRDANREQQLNLTLAAIAATKAQPVTADQLAALIVARVPQAKVTASDLDKLPDAPVAQRSIRDYILSCDACTVERDSLNQAVANRDTQIADLNTQLQQAKEQKQGVEKERDAAVKAAKGGSTFRRTLAAMKYIGIGIGIGALVVAH